jgi:phosphoribosylglycinamide formyltransferase-1
MIKILVCSSGGGSNFHSLIEKSRVYQSYEVGGLVVDRACGAVEIAHKFQVQVKQLDIKSDFTNQLKLEFRRFDLVVLAGFLPIISAEAIQSIGGRIINTHPSLLPKHGGKGMYGVRVQESVLKSNDRVTGCTVHQVNSKIDDGLILAQSKLDIPDGSDPWALGGLVHNLERELLPLTVHKIAIGEITLAI